MSPHLVWLCPRQAVVMCHPISGASKNLRNVLGSVWFNFSSQLQHPQASNLVPQPSCNADPSIQRHGFGGYNQYSLSLVTSYYSSYFAKGSSYSAYNLSLVFANLAWWPNCTAKGQFFGKKLRILSPSKTWKKCKQPLKKALVFVPSCNDQWKLSKDSGVFPFDIINEEVACLKQCVPYDTHITQAFLADFTIHHPHKPLPPYGPHYGSCNSGNECHKCNGCYLSCNFKL